jgi:hypothetical protein
VVAAAGFAPTQTRVAGGRLAEPATAGRLCDQGLAPVRLVAEVPCFNIGHEFAYPNLPRQLSDPRI